MVLKSRLGLCLQQILPKNPPLECRLSQSAVRAVTGVKLFVFVVPFLYELFPTNRRKQWENIALIL